MIRELLAIALTGAVAFPVSARPIRPLEGPRTPPTSPIVVSPLGDYAENGLTKAISAQLIRSDGAFAQKLRFAVRLLKTFSVSEVSNQTGIKPAVLQRLIEMGTPIPTELTALPEPPPLPIVEVKPEPPSELKPASKSATEAPPSFDKILVEGFGLAPVTASTFNKPQKFKVGKGLSLVESPFEAKQSPESLPKPTERLTPSERALLELENAKAQTKSAIQIQSNPSIAGDRGATGKGS
jgi:hypothetical protein